MGAQKKAIDATVLGYVGQWLGMTENNLSQVTSKIHKSVFTIIVDSTLKLRLQWEFTCKLGGWVHVHINLSKGLNVIKAFFWIKTKSGTQVNYFKFIKTSILFVYIFPGLLRLCDGLEIVSSLAS